VNSPDVAAYFGVTNSGAEVNFLALAQNGCDAARKCLNNNMTPQSCSASGPQSCMGTILQSCGTLTGTNGQTATSSFDCATYGEMCVQGKGTVNCGLGTCNAPSPSTCVGTKLQSCDGNGITHQLDCAIFNSTCVTSIAAHCRGTGPTCSTQITNANSSLRCDGTRLVTCADGQEASFDCASIQTGCFANAKGNAFDCALGNSCDPRDLSTPKCMGTKLSFCNNGKMDTFDCASSGFKGCDPSGGGRCTN
jgi:hypothetical protein